MLSHLKAAVTCLVVFAELDGLREVLAGGALPLPFSLAHQCERDHHTARFRNTKGSLNTTGTPHWSGKPARKVLYISRQMLQVALAALWVLYLENQEEP